MSSASQSFRPVSPETLADQVSDLKKDGWRLVQISATRLPEDVELTYSFDRNLELANLRMTVPASAKVPSISPVFWCAVLYENEIHDLFGLQIDGIAIDFKGNLYKTTVKHPFGTTRPPAAAPRSPAPSSPAAPKPAAIPVSAA